jgi:hypothetical protein
MFSTCFNLGPLNPDLNRCEHFLDNEMLTRCLHRYLIIAMLVSSRFH